MSEHKGGLQPVAPAHRRARPKPLLLVPIIAIVLFVSAPLALFLLRTGLALPRIRIEYDCRDSTPAKAPPPPLFRLKSTEEQRFPPPRQLSDQPYSLGPVASGYDARRAEWLRAHPQFPAFVAPGRPRVLMVTGSAPGRCKDPAGDRAFKNKADYCRAHGLDIFYSDAVLDAELSGFWTKLPLLRALMVAHPEAELLWWVDADAVFTDMLFEPPWRRYARHNLVLGGRDEAVYGARDWLGLNDGIFLLRNCRWSLELLDACATATGGSSPRCSPTGRSTRPTTSRRSSTCSPRSGGGGGTRCSSRAPTTCTGSGRGSSTGTRTCGGSGARGSATTAGRSSRTSSGASRAGIKTRATRPCGDQDPNFADDQILKLYGFEHESLNTTAVRRVRNDFGRPMDTDGWELGRLLHPAFRAARM